MSSDVAWMRLKRCLALVSTICLISRRVGRGCSDLMLRLLSWGRSISGLIECNAQVQAMGHMFSIHGSTSSYLKSHNSFLLLIMHSIIAQIDAPQTQSLTHHTFTQNSPPPPDSHTPPAPTSDPPSPPHASTTNSTSSTPASHDLHYLGHDHHLCCHRGPCWRGGCA